MLRLHHTSTLIITDMTEYSVFAKGDGYSRISVRDVPDGLQIGDAVRAYVYLDASDEIAASMAQAYAAVGECAHLEVASIAKHGTFLKWGLPKDLFMPFSEQTRSVRAGDLCFVHIYQDASERPVASMRLHRHLNEYGGDFEAGQAVDLMIAGKSEMGFKAVINNAYLGLIYHEELAHPLEIGVAMKGWISKIRDDGKINVNINRLDDETRDDLEDTILAYLKNNDGRLNLSDKSPPDLIYAQFRVSKKNFKRALGSLYRKRFIKISPKFVELIAKV